jgi:hypothetical protein
MLPAGHVVQLIPEKTIVADAGKLQNELRKGQSCQDKRGAECPLAWTCGCERANAKFVNSSFAHAGWAIAE